jgi:monoamine oxidase
VLGGPVGDRLFFAGEACSPDFFSTAHGAYLSGIEAARSVLASQRVNATA